MTRVFLILAALVIIRPAAVSGEELWQVRGDIQAITPGSPETVSLRLADGRIVEVPFDSLSAASQAAARRAVVASPAAATAGDDRGGVVTVRGPFGRPVRVTVPECIKDVEADAIQCRTAGDAADVYRLALASERFSQEQRAAAAQRLPEWEALAATGSVRLGDRWVSPDEARDAAAEADKLVGHALELMRVGNADLAEDELRNAARIDPERGRAGFVLGLAYAVVGKNYGKAADLFAETVWREPANAAVLADLGVLEVLTRRSATAAEHFGTAVECAADPLPVADNVAWAVKLAGDAKVKPSLGKYRMPEKTVEELNALYRILSQGLKLKPAEVTEEPRFLGPDGVLCTATTLAEIASLFENAMPSQATRHALGFLVAPGHVLCPRHVLLEPDGSTLSTVWISVPKAGADRLAATIVSAPTHSQVALLLCEGLSLDALPLADVDTPPADILAVCRAGDSWLDVRLQAVSGHVLASDSQFQSNGRFILSAVAPDRAGGGPIIDKKGRVVGMMLPTPRTDASGVSAHFGISVARIAQDIENVSQVAKAAVPGTAGDTAPAERRAIAATVMVSSVQQDPQPKVTGEVPP